ncbi:MAG: fructosamine kinase family protein [Mangrovicoccus sp.]
MTLSDRIAALCGAEVTSTRPLHGGDLSEVYLCQTPQGPVVAKAGAQVSTEARMLRVMAKAGAPVPQVLGATSGLLVLEYLPDSPATDQSWSDLGQALRHLHRSGTSPYGWDMDYAFGAVEIPNAPHSSWPEFWAENRLRPSLASLPKDTATRLERLADDLPNRLPEAPWPGLLHGDLWHGNLQFSRNGAYLIDPACYMGDGEVDLAMLHLFGSPAPAFSDAYGALAEGWQDRRAIYQLWPALVHYRLFGASYHAMVIGILQRLGV